jgi:hypothetical protein
MADIEREYGVEAIVAQHVVRQGWRNAFLNDAQYHAEVHQLTRIFTMVDEAMENEDIPQRTRDRVIRACIFGTPDNVDAEARIDQRARALETLRQGPVRVIDEIDLRDVGVGRGVTLGWHTDP